MIECRNRSLDARWGVPIAALAALLLLVALAPSAASAAPATGQATIVPQPGQAKTDLLKQGVKLSGGAKGNGGRIVLRVTDLSFGKVATAGVGGSVVFSRGKRKVVVRGLSIRVGRPAVNVRAAAAGTAVAGKLGKRSLVLFRARGQSKSVANTVGLRRAPLVLTSPAAKALGPRLGLAKVKPGRLGLLNLSAVQNDVLKKDEPQPKEEQPQPPPDLDPYFAQCKLSATSEVEGSLPVSEPLSFSGATKGTVGDDVTWGFKESFRGYVIGSGGSVQALDGATANGGPFPSSFTFPSIAGEYAVNDPIDLTDDQAVINGSGTALFCNKPHGFRVVISKPTIVIDGEDSRIVADLDTNMTGVWTPPQRIDLAALDLTGITPFYNYSGAEVTWSDIPATLTEPGAEAICGGDPHCTYVPGEEIDRITARAKTPYDTSDLDALATYVQANLPFPLTDPTIGGCTLQTPIPNPLIIDADDAINWLDSADNPQPLPSLGTGEAVSGGGLDWGVRSSLRTTVNMTGEFNLAGGTTASDQYFGNGGSGTRSMNGADKFFTWPAASSGGVYDAGGAGSGDDRLVLRTQGRVALCQSDPTRGSYGTVLSNPTVIIDGAKSRITIDVATRYRFSWVRGVVDFATLDLSGATPDSKTEGGTTTVSWKFPNATGTPAVGPVALTKGGELVVRMLSINTYVDGLGLDGVTVRASFPEEE